MRFDNSLMPALMGLGMVLLLAASWWLVGWVLVPFVWRLF